MYKSITFIIIALFLTLQNYAQENLDEDSSKEKIHKLAFVFGYTHIPEAFEEGEEMSSVFVPTIGIDYFLQIAEKWSIGAVLDYEMQKYKVNFKESELDRENAVITGILVGYEFAECWGLLMGPGLEFEKNKNLFIFRAAIEYEFELNNNWAIVPSVNNDFKEEYSTYALSIGVNKKF